MLNENKKNINLTQKRYKLTKKDQNQLKMLKNVKNSNKSTKIRQFWGTSSDFRRENH